MKRWTEFLPASRICGGAGVALWLCSCSERDPGGELVNASGLTTNEVMAVLSSGADVNRRSTRFSGYTPLIVAIRNNKMDIIDVLIRAGADVNLKDSEGRTPLMHALMDWEPKISLVTILIANGANPRIPDRDGFDAYAYANQRTNALQIAQALNAGSMPRK